MRRRWKWLIGGAVAAAVLPTAALVGERYYRRVAYEKVLASVVADLDRTAPGWRLAELRQEQLRNEPPDEQNSSVQAAQLWNRLPESVAIGLVLRRPDRLPLRPSPRLPHVAELDDLQDNLAPHTELVAAARRLTGLRSGGTCAAVPVDDPLGTLHPQTVVVATLTDLLDRDARQASATGDPERAVADLAAVLSLTAGLEGDWSIEVWETRVRCELRAVALAEQLTAWARTAHLPDEARKQFAKLGAADCAALAVRGQRAVLDQLFERMDNGRMRPRMVLGSPRSDLEGWTEPVNDWRFRADLPADRARMLELFTGWETALRRPTWEREAAFAAVELPPDGAPYRTTLATLPSIGKLVAADLTCKARVSSAAVGLACERFRQQSSRWPNDLAELKELLPVIPLDPYDGQPLRYRKLADGVVVYAVGPDRQDDGGKLSYGNPQSGEDVGFRLWDVAARRQPAEE